METAFSLIFVEAFAAGWGCSAARAGVYNPLAPWPAHLVVVAAVLAACTISDMFAHGVAIAFAAMLSIAHIAKLNGEQDYVVYTLIITFIAVRGIGAAHTKFAKRDDAG